MGNRFFQIVGVFAYAIAGLALLITIFLGLGAAGSYFGGVDDRIRLPKPTVKSYLEAQSAVESVSQQRQEGARSDANKARVEAQKRYQEKLRPSLESLVTSLTQYAMVTDQPTVNEEGLENFLRQSTSVLDQDEYLLFIKALSDEVKGLVRQEQKSKKKSTKTVEWIEFVSWFTTTYIEQYQAELDRIQAEQAELMVSRGEGIAKALAAVSAFAVFVVFTLILLMVKIEFNTRHRVGNEGGDIS